MERHQPALAAPGPQPTGRDLVDLVSDDWRREMPDLDDAAIELTRRVMRLAGILHDRLTAHSARWNLTKGEVNVLATLRSVGSPYELRPTDLKARLLLSSGGISNVINRLEKNSLIERQPDSSDGRSCWVRLTSEGAELAYAFARSWTEVQIDTYRAASPAVVQLASDALREVLLALGDDEPPPREDRTAP
jgi:DNA-binding MarR family transcriptional regulator